MKGEKTRSVVFTFTGMLLILTLAYIFDLWREYTSNYFLETSNNLYGIYWSYLITTFILSFSIMYWSWIIIEKVEIQKWMYIILIIPSLIIILYPILFYSPQGLPYWIYRLTPSSQVYLISGIIIMIAILKIVKSKQ